MYTYNLLIFGHDLSTDENLLRDVNSLGIEIESMKVDDLKFEMRTRYHGGSSEEPLVLGTEITDTDNNKNFLSEARNAKEETYAPSYGKYLEILISTLEADKNVEKEYDDVCDRLVHFLRTTPPTFYMLEVSS